MKHFIVNIGCEYGSGGPDIGKMVAESLGIPFYDRDLVDQVVEKLGVDRDLVEKADSGEENVSFTFLPDILIFFQRYYFMLRTLQPPS